MKNSKRIEYAERVLFDNTPIDYIIETVETPDYVQFVGNAGGDYLTYRVFDNGSIYAK